MDKIALLYPDSDRKKLMDVFSIFLPYIKVYYPAADDWFSKSVIPQLKDELRRIWVCKIASRPVAISILKYYVQNDTHAKICTFLVDPEFRNQGIGSKLLFDVLDWHDKQGYTSIRIHCPKSVQPILEPLLLKSHFKISNIAKPITSTTELEVGYQRLHPFF